MNLIPLQHMNKIKAVVQNLNTHDAENIVSATRVGSAQGSGRSREGQPPPDNSGADVALGDFNAKHIVSGSLEILLIITEEY